MPIFGLRFLPVWGPTAKVEIRPRVYIMDQLFTEPECGDMLREVLAYFTATPWATDEYGLWTLKHSVIYFLATRNSNPSGSRDFLRRIRDDVRQYAAVAGVCKWTYEVAKGIAGNPLSAWCDILAQLTSAGGFTGCDIVGLTFDADGRIWPLSGNHRPTVLRRGQMYLDCDMRGGGGGIRCHYDLDMTAVGGASTSVSIDRVYDTVSVLFYVEFTADIPGVEIRGDSREEVYENLLQYIEDNLGIVKTWRVVIGPCTYLNIEYVNIEYRGTTDGTGFCRSVTVSPAAAVVSLSSMPEDIPHRDEVVAILALCGLSILGEYDQL